MQGAGHVASSWGLWAGWRLRQPPDSASAQGSCLLPLPALQHAASHKAASKPRALRRVSSDLGLGGTRTPAGGLEQAYRETGPEVRALQHGLSRWGPVLRPPALVGAMVGFRHCGCDARRSCRLPLGGGGGLTAAATEPRALGADMCPGAPHLPALVGLERGVQSRKP